MPTSRIRPKHWQVMKRTTRSEKGVKVGNKFYRYGTNGAFTVNDPGVAAEMRKYHAADVVVAEVDKPRMDVSKNWISVPELPWHKKKGKTNGKKVNAARRRRPVRQTQTKTAGQGS